MFIGALKDKFIELWSWKENEFCLWVDVYLNKPFHNAQTSVSLMHLLVDRKARPMLIFTSLLMTFYDVSHTTQIQILHGCHGWNGYLMELKRV